MKFYILFGIFAVVVGSIVSFRLESITEIESSEEDRIIGGSTAEPGQFPFQISLRGPVVLENGTILFQHRCGGNIISDRWILTVAHCTQAKYANTSNVLVVVGAHHVINGGEAYEVEQIIYHAEYNSSAHLNDIAVLRTTRPIVFNDVVQPIPLEGAHVEGGEEAVIVGWGAEKYIPGESTYPYYLKFVEVYTLDNDVCEVLHDPEQARRIYNGTICTILAHGEGACYGDSGGPLVSGGKLIGLVSWGVPCATGRPDQFTRVSTFLDWIAENTDVVPNN